MRSRQQQTLVFSIIGGIGFFLILTTVWLYLRQHKFLKYENKLYGFSLKYPAAWAYAENQGGAAAIFYAPAENELDIFKENVNIVIQDISKNPMGLEEYTKTAIRQMQLVFEQNLVILESEPTLIDGRAAHRFVFLGKGPEAELRFMCLWTLVDMTAYQITYTAIDAKYDKYIDQVKSLVRSFKIKQ
ncbi:MAG: hypothetical protein A3D87_01215 [Omnitrophica WOR_2 bacterium RIFCSPHIGHO2_02_FULL_50_17]|nr:MAG: hypothetical protein A3D87_01215 [Omnitrophica WOR_2 bacterium RIFCSPHIGHO2_02_FULL_50_17]